MRNTKGISAFLYRAPIYIEDEIYVYTTGFDSMVHPFELDDAESYIVQMVENSEKYRKVFADRLRSLANRIESGDCRLGGYIADYDSYDYEGYGVIDIDWNKELSKK